MGSALAEVVVEIERYVGQQGWDQPPRLFALAETADLLREEPRLAAQLGLGTPWTGAGTGAGPGEDGEAPPLLTPIEQEELPEFASLEELLQGMAWPPQVLGTALVVERLMLPPEAEVDMPQEEAAALAWLAAHPQRQEVRIAVGVLRDGSRECALRLRSADTDDAVLTGPDLVPGLAAALAATLAD